jgi:hypothetical protein
VGWGGDEYDLKSISGQEAGKNVFPQGHYATRRMSRDDYAIEKERSELGTSGLGGNFRHPFSLHVRFE